MEKFSLPVWLKNGPEISKLALAFGDYWDKAEGWLKTPLRQMDAETCHVAVLKLLAYQRDVDRFAGEPDDLFRKRVAFAVQNAMDAGYSGGMKRVFERFDMPLLGQIERDPSKDWDVITLWLGDSTITQDPELGEYIIRKYGRTCRRYEFLIVDVLEPATLSAVLGCIERQKTVAGAVPEWTLIDQMGTVEVGAMSGVLDRQTTYVPAMNYVYFEFFDELPPVSFAALAGLIDRQTTYARGV